MMPTPGMAVLQSLPAGRLPGAPPRFQRQPTPIPNPNTPTGKKKPRVSRSLLRIQWADVVANWRTSWESWKWSVGALMVDYELLPRKLNVATPVQPSVLSESGEGNYIR